MPKLPGRPKTDPYWTRRIEELVEQENLGAKALADRLLGEAIATGRDDAPAVRTCQRIRDAFRALNEPARRRRRALQWPESMGSPDLPWPASRAALDLLQYVREHPSPTLPPEPPTVGLAVWFWRVTLAAPDVSTSSHFAAAATLYANELVNGFAAHQGGLEAFLAANDPNQEWNAGPVSLAMARNPHQRIEQRDRERASKEADDATSK